MFKFPWKAEETFFISSSLCVLDDKSQTQPFTLNPLASHSWSLSSSSFLFLEHVYILAPNPANSSTIAYLLYIYQVKEDVKKSTARRRRRTRGKQIMCVTHPMPLVPPVTRAVIPLRDHLFLVCSNSTAIFFFLCVFLLLLLLLSEFLIFLAYNLLAPLYKQIFFFSCFFNFH